ncbi:GH3 auxin-responsive promoter family protein [Nibricoccus sp. IMCC34717]|uniref:GH3 family domain-containing protein n=1 Tax=Nibricoccus sp. IMCC34717 TaxID=3034021 RepID=UPI0038513ACA
MASLSQSLVRTGAYALRLRTWQQLRNPAKDFEAQHRLFGQLIARLSACSNPLANGVTPRMSYGEFRSNVPLRTYEDFHPLIDRMRAGEADLLWPGRCRHYAVSSGTTAGRTKYLPVTDDLITHFRRTGLDSLLWYAARVRTTTVFGGKHLFLGGSTALVEETSANGFTSFSGDLSGITALNLPSWAERHLYEPGRDLALVDNWPLKLRAIAERTRSRDVRLVAGIPSWLLIFADTVLQGRSGDVRSVWPHLECLIHGGVPIAPYVDTLRAAFGASTNFHEVFPASEGFIAAQDSEAAAGLRLMARHGIFYEFLKLSDYDEDRRAELGSRCVPLEGVRPGVDYVVVMTAPSGLCRYIIGDVVRFVSTSPARLVYAGRTRLQLSAFGEHVSELDLTEAVVRVSRHHGLRVHHFHVAPLFANPTEGRTRGAHEWLIELESGSPHASEDTLASELDAELIARNDDYDAKRKGGGLCPPVVHVVPAGTFETWLRSKGKWGGQNKMPRCRGDRVIANDLSTPAAAR